MKKNILLSILFAGFSGFAANGQQLLSNPSFEGVPGDNSPPPSWQNCNFLSTMDTQPGPWNVNTPPYEGNTYVSVVARDANDADPNRAGTVEDCGQVLIQPLEAGRRYRLEIHLCYSNTFTGGVDTGYGQPARLRVWLGSLTCSKEEQVWQSPVVDHTDWQQYKVEFVPDAQRGFITLEAAHANNNTRELGNVMLDNAILVALDEEEEPQDTTTAVTGQPCHFYLPNSFSPNDDGRNDRFQVFAKCPILSFRMQLYNRWGSLVFESEDISQGWDGRYKEEPAPNDTYGLIVEYEYYDEQGRKQRAVESGEVVLVR